MTTVSTPPPSGTRALGTPIDQIGVAYAGLPGNLIANAVESASAFSASLRFCRSCSAK
ncbi:MAG: hypothetical protein QME21_12170 [Anaerolineales bacterium]|nr:hypothetical protein [Anaerolineales bacterium]